MVQRPVYDVGIVVDVEKGKAVDKECCGLVIGINRSGLPKGMARELDKALDGTLSSIVAGIDVGPEPGKIHMMFTKHLPIMPERIILTGVGKSGKRARMDEVRQGMAVATNLVEKKGLKEIVAVFPPGGSVELARTMVEGFVIGSYRWDRYKGKKRNGARSFTLLVENAKDLKNAAKGAEAGKVASESVWMVRDLANTPGNELTPMLFEELIGKVAKASGVTFRSFGPKEIKRMEMAGLQAVNRGSGEEPRFFELEYIGKGSGGKKARPIVLVGKAVTFDTGGISLKPVANMDQMKYDMSGGATVLGVISAAARLNLPLRIVGLIPCTDNMPGGMAYKPGDVIKYRNGRTVEVISTDAEGRLILADALLRAGELEPRYVVDIATLTGGVKIALARKAAAVLGNDDRLVNALIKAGMGEAERLWRLPMWDDYGDLIKGDTADIKNSGGREGSTITATMFLSNFVSYPWAHIDIAGMGWTERARGYIQKGSVGFGVRMFIQWLSGLRSK
jgi:leucyl aminopeptidase